MIDFPGADSYRVTGTPSRSRIEVRKSAAAVTSPGGLEVLIRMYCCSVRIASSWTPVRSGAWLAAAEHEASSAEPHAARTRRAIDDPIRDMAQFLFENGR